jgi:hypothetical protein
MAVHGICGSGANPYQDFIVAGRWPFHILAMENVW